MLDKKPKLFENIKHVKQECGQSCGIACVAMVTGKTFNSIRKQVKQVPISHRTLDKLLKDNGIIPVRTIYQDLLPDKVYIVAVPSLNRSCGMHYIVMDTYEDEVVVYDPNQGFSNKDYYDISMIRSWGVTIAVVPIIADKED